MMTKWVAEEVLFFKARLVRETARAIQVSILTMPDKKVWLPKSQVVDATFEKEGEAGEIHVTRWIAEKAELVKRKPRSVDGKRRRKRST